MVYAIWYVDNQEHLWQICRFVGHPGKGMLNKSVYHNFYALYHLMLSKKKRKKLPKLLKRQEADHDHHHHLFIL